LPDRSVRERLRKREGKGNQPLFFAPPVGSRRTSMDTEITGIVMGVVLPLYPLLFVIYQKIGTYDEIVSEFRKLRDEHENYKGIFHGK
jgi:hypothetical protein